jgi:hypothetical protein
MLVDAFETSCRLRHLSDRLNPHDLQFAYGVSVGVPLLLATALSCGTLDVGELRQLNRHSRFIRVVSKFESFDATDPTIGDRWTWRRDAEFDLARALLLFVRFAIPWHQESSALAFSENCRLTFKNVLLFGIRWFPSASVTTDIITTISPAHDLEPLSLQMCIARPDDAVAVSVGGDHSGTFPDFDQELLCDMSRNSDDSAPSVNPRFSILQQRQLPARCTYLFMQAIVSIIEAAASSPSAASQAALAEGIIKSLIFSLAHCLDVDETTKQLIPELPSSSWIECVRCCLAVAFDSASAHPWMLDAVRRQSLWYHVLHIFVRLLKEADEIESHMEEIRISYVQVLEFSLKFAAFSAEKRMSAHELYQLVRVATSLCAFLQSMTASTPASVIDTTNKITALTFFAIHKWIVLSLSGGGDVAVSITLTSVREAQIYSPDQSMTALSAIAHSVVRLLSFYKTLHPAANGICAVAARTSALKVLFHLTAVTTMKQKLMQEPIAWECILGCMEVDSDTMTSQLLTSLTQLLPTASKGSAHTNTAIESFVQKLNRFQSSASHFRSVQRLIEILNCIQRLLPPVNARTYALQSVMANCGMLSCVMNILGSPAARVTPSICVDVINTFTRLIAGNKHARDMCAEHLRHIKATLEAEEYSQMFPTLFKPLMELLMEKPYTSQEGTCSFENRCVIDLIFHLTLRESDRNLVDEVLTVFIAHCIKSAHNRNECVEAGLLSQVGISSLEILGGKCCMIQQYFCQYCHENSLFSFALRRIFCLRFLHYLL